MCHSQRAKTSKVLSGHPISLFSKLAGISIKYLQNSKLDSKFSKSSSWEGIQFLEMFKKFGVQLNF